MLSWSLPLVCSFRWLPIERLPARTKNIGVHNSKIEKVLGYFKRKSIQTLPGVFRGEATDSSKYAELIPGFRGVDSSVLGCRDGTPVKELVGVEWLRLVLRPTSMLLELVVLGKQEA